MALYRSLLKDPKFSEIFREAAITEGADELMVRAEEMAPQRAFTNTEDAEFEECSAQQFTMELKGKYGKSCTVTTENQARLQELRSQVKVKG